MHSSTEPTVNLLCRMLLMSSKKFTVSRGDSILPLPWSRKRNRKSKTFQIYITHKKDSSYSEKLFKKTACKERSGCHGEQTLYNCHVTSSYWEKPWWTTHVKEKPLMCRDLPVCAGASWAGSCWSAAGGRCCLPHKCSSGHCRRACLPAGSLHTKRQTD